MCLCVCVCVCASLCECVHRANTNTVPVCVHTPLAVCATLDLYLELVLKSGQSSLSISLAQILNGPSKVTGRDLSVSTGDRLQYSIIEEDVLLLWEYRCLYSYE